MSLSQKQIEQYIAAGGVSCPYCHDPDLEGGFVEIRSDGAAQPIRCHACDRRWTDEYRLVGLTAEEDGIEAAAHEPNSSATVDEPSESADGRAGLLDSLHWTCPTCQQILLQPIGSLSEAGTAVCPDCGDDCADPRPGVDELTAALQGISKLIDAGNAAAIAELNRLIADVWAAGAS